MRYLTTVVTTTILAVATTACSTNPVFTDADPNHDFSGYKTFSWSADKPMISDAHVNPLAERRIMESIKANLSGKGYQFLDQRGSADFVVSFSVGTRDKIQIRSEPAVFAGPYYDRWTWGYEYFPPRMPRVTSSNYVEGSLAIDIYDVQGRRPVWHSSASKRLSKSDFSNPSASIRGAVDTIMKGFPPN